MNLTIHYKALEEHFLMVLNHGNIFWNILKIFTAAEMIPAAK
jgi:hypothetical protein